MRVVTFGEAMLRLSPSTDSSLEKAPAYAVEVAGAEANVAVALARLGVDARWVSTLPRNDLGRRIAGSIREHGVDTRITWTDEGRVGLYFVELGSTPRPPHVIYDRSNSAFALLQPDDIDDSVLEGADLLHVTGITPAISAGARQATLKLMYAASERGLCISFEVNYRSKLVGTESAQVFVRQVAPLLRSSSHDPASLLLGLHHSAIQCPPYTVRCQPPYGIQIGKKS